MFRKALNKILPQRNVVYDATFFQKQWFQSWDILKLVLQKLIESNPSWKKILDFGCGPGIMIDHMNQAGFLYIGCDYSADTAKLYHENYGQYPELYVNSLTNPICQQSIDVFLSFDVFEHLTDLQIEGVLKQIPSISTLFLNISRAKGIPGHINLKSDGAWISFMQGLGYGFDSSATERMRQVYISLRPEASDSWDKNLFIFQKFIDKLEHDDIK